MGEEQMVLHSSNSKVVIACSFGFIALLQNFSLNDANNNLEIAYFSASLCFLFLAIFSAVLSHLTIASVTRSNESRFWRMNNKCFQNSVVISELSLFYGGVLSLVYLAISMT